MFGWKKKRDAQTIEACGRKLADGLIKRVSVEGRCRAEDLIATSASITGELCIDAAGQWRSRTHTFIPGQRVFGDAITNLLCGREMSAQGDGIASGSAIDGLRRRLLASGFDAADFPSMRDVCEHFAKNIGNPADWGKVPLSVPQENQPYVMPLMVAYRLRSVVDELFKPLGSDSMRRFQAAMSTLAVVLVTVRSVIDRKTALLVALPILNGMAKTAPMTDEAMRKMQAAPKAPDGGVES